MSSDSYRDDAADARRYRWLRSKPQECPAKGLDVVTWENCGGDSVRGDALDAEVDAEIAAEQLRTTGLTPQEDDEAQAENDRRPD